MSERALSSTLVIAAAGLAAFGVVAGAVVAGYWLGTRAAPALEDGVLTKAPGGGPGSVEGVARYAGPTPWIALDPGTSSDWEAVAGEVALAAEAGFHCYAIPVSLPWGEAAPSRPWERVLEVDPAARFVLRLSLMPPASWLGAHPEAAAQLDEASRAWPSLASGLWRESAADAVGRLLAEAPVERLDGIVLEAFEDGRWFLASRDRGGVAVDDFRAWLAERYSDEERLRTAWGDAAVTFAGADIPPAPAPRDGAVFLDEADRPAQTDYRHYEAERTAGALASFAQACRSMLPDDVGVHAAYGETFERLANEGGHLGLGAVLDSALDGFVTPVSYHDRGLGGVGGFMGPVDSATSAGKTWYVLDDTRTGISRNPATGDIDLLAGLRLEDVRAVHTRNFGAAMAHGAGVAWADPGGAGRLLDASLWRNFALMRDSQDRFLADRSPGRGPVTLSVVVDEPSRFVLASEDINESLLLGARDAAFCAGVPAQCVLLEDVLAGRASATPVYLFLNAFRLTAGQRERLHERLAREHAAAIWLYAPGYYAPDPDPAHVAATTRFDIAELDAGVRGGSRYALDSRLLEPGGAFGRVEPLRPAFEIRGTDTEEVTVLARYAESDAVSAAMRFTEDDWASVYVAEPAITPALLRQILLILTHHVYLDEPRGVRPDAAWFREDLLVVHGRGLNSRDSRLLMPAPVDLRSLLDERLGWFETDAVDLGLRLGETRVLAVTKRYEVPLPDDGPVPES